MIDLPYNISLAIIMHHSELSQRQILDSLGPVLVASPATGISYANKPLKEEFGLTHDLPPCYALLGFKKTCTRCPLLKIAENHDQQKPKPTHFLIRRAGRIYDSQITLATNGENRVVVHEFTDVTKKKKKERMLKKYANNDRLTGLYNRNYLENCLTRFRGDQRPWYVVFIDVNKLKKTNDRKGHYAGDALLKDVTTILNSSFRKRDIIIRRSGDEFIVLMPVDNNTKNAKRMIARRLLDQTRAFNVSQNKKVSFAFGTAFARNGVYLDDAIKTADKRMYYNKQRKRLRKKVKK